MIKSLIRHYVDEAVGKKGTLKYYCWYNLSECKLAISIQVKNILWSKSCTHEKLMHIHMCTKKLKRIFIAALLVITEDWKQHKCPSLDG